MKGDAVRSVLGICHHRGYTPSPSIYWNHGVREKLRTDLLESTACRQNLGNKVVKTSLCGQSKRFRLDDDRLSKLWMARSDVTAREWLASRKRRTKWKCPARLLAALAGKGSPSASLRAGFRLRKPIRFANRFAPLRMTVHCSSFQTLDRIFEEQKLQDTSNCDIVCSRSCRLKADGR